MFFSPLGGEKNPIVMECTFFQTLIYVVDGNRKTFVIYGLIVYSKVNVSHTAAFAQQTDAWLHYISYPPKLMAANGAATSQSTLLPCFNRQDAPSDKWTTPKQTSMFVLKDCEGCS